MRQQKTCYLKQNTSYSHPTPVDENNSLITGNLNAHVSFTFLSQYAHSPKEGTNFK